MRLAAELVAFGANPTEIARHVYEQAPFGYLKVAGVALSRAELDEELSLVSTVLTQKDLNEAGIDWSDTDNLLGTLRLAEEADTAVIVKVHDDGGIKVSLRSRGSNRCRRASCLPGRWRPSSCRRLYQLRSSGGRSQRDSREDR